MSEARESRTALVLGASGGVGGEIARRLARGGWTVRALHRDPAKVEAVRYDALDWVKGDAMSARDVRAAAEGAGLIVHAVNPPGYRNWAELAPAMLESSIEAAEAEGARLMLPGTVYNFGPDAFPLIDEDAPQRPTTRKGRIRVAMERRIAQAVEGGMRALILRAGDYFGPAPGNNWFSQALVRPGRPVTRVGYPGKPGVGHQWAYLPDVAETLFQLLERERTLPGLARFHMDGHWDPDGAEMIEAIRRAVGDPALPVKPTPWLPMRLAAPLSPLMREILEMKYLWDRPVRLSNARLVAFLGEEPRTPLDRAVRATLAGLGCKAGQLEGATEDEAAAWGSVRPSP